MDIKGLIKLNNAGYSLAEIKEMKNRDTVIELLDNGITRGDIPYYIEALEEAEKTEEPEKPEKPEEPEEPEETEKTEKAEEETYKEKYEKLLREKQEKERRKPIDDNNVKTAEDVLKELALEFM